MKENREINEGIERTFLFFMVFYDHIRKRGQKPYKKYNRTEVFYK